MGFIRVDTLPLQEIGRGLVYVALLIGFQNFVENLRYIQIIGMHVENICLLLCMYSTFKENKDFFRMLGKVHKDVRIK